MFKAILCFSLLFGSFAMASVETDSLQGIYQGMIVSSEKAAAPIPVEVTFVKVNHLNATTGEVKEVLHGFWRTYTGAFVSFGYALDIAYNSADQNLFMKTHGGYSPSQLFWTMNTHVDDAAHISGDVFTQQGYVGKLTLQRK